MGFGRCLALFPARQDKMISRGSCLMPHPEHSLSGVQDDSHLPNLSAHVVTLEIEIRSSKSFSGRSSHWQSRAAVGLRVAVRSSPPDRSCLRLKFRLLKATVKQAKQPAPRGRYRIALLADASNRLWRTFGSGGESMTARASNCTHAGQKIVGQRTMVSRDINSAKVSDAPSDLCYGRHEGILG